MKRISIFVFALIITIFVFANDFIKPAQIAIDDQHQVTNVGTRNGHREQDPPPEYSFILNGNGDPTTFLASSYYDYMPYSYNGYNVRIQPEVSMPNGYSAGGVYITYMRSETQNVGFDRRAFFSYLNSDGTLGESGSINNEVNREGFTSCAVDPYTASPIAVWHAITEPDGTYDSHMSYLPYHETGGSWRTPFIVIDNPEMSEPITGHYDDEFIWPQVHIGPSPLSDHRRVHVYGNNYSNTNYNSFYLYADFDDVDLLQASDLDWTVQSFPYFDYLAYNDIVRINKDMIASEDDGKVVFFGNVADSLFALYSDDYGETFTKYTRQIKQPMYNPVDIETGNYLWVNDDGSPAEMYIVPSNDLTHYNGIFTDKNTKIQWMSGVNYNSAENIANGNYFLAYIYPKIFTFDTDLGEFSFYELDVQDSNPGDNILTVAFDYNDDGVVDEYDTFTIPHIIMSYPVWCYDGNYHYYDESNCKMASNENWVVCVWHDSAKLYHAYHGEPGYEGWIEQPEICIIISDDNGETWSDIRYINANPNDAIIDTTYHYDGNFAPELDGMLPVNITLGDKLEIISNEPDNYHAKLHFAFFDDEIYGSSTPNSGGNLHYAAIDLEFQEEWIDPVSINEETVPHPDVQLFNYPNPFNPETNIVFNLPEDGDVQLDIYNIKGQKIKSLIYDQLSFGQHSVVWDGKDSNDKQVGSGIYLYKLNLNGNTEVVNKCLLLK